jgi:hypothetical protein
MIEQYVLYLLAVAYLCGMVSHILELRCVKKRLKDMYFMLNSIAIEHPSNVVPIPAKPRAGGNIKHRPYIPKEVVDQNKTFLP